MHDHVSFVDGLRAAGLVVDIQGRTSRAFLRPPGTLLGLSGGAISTPAVLESFNYDSTDLGEAGAVVARKDLARIPVSDRSCTDCHIYLRDRVLVLYRGTEAAVLTVLAQLLGAPAAGRIT